MDIVWMVSGITLAAFGGEFFVRGSVGLAKWLRIPAGIVGATVAAFATSSPEMSVSILASLDGRPEIALGDAAGSNLVNLGVVLGLTVLVSPVIVRVADVRRELPIGIAAMGMLWVFAGDGSFSRSEAGLFLGVFLFWLVWVVRDARRDRVDVEALPSAGRGRTVFELLIGLGLLVLAGRLVVTAAKGFGESLGWSEFVVGSLLVAIGTSTPEFVTAIIATRRGHSEVGVGAVLGSNIFNTLFIIGIAGLIHPITGDIEALEIAVILGIVGTVLVVPNRLNLVGRMRGVALLGLYATFVVSVLVV
ncbi:MAG: calcium/sodium antiporter [Ilumatobacteraceae bacterium]